MNPGFGKGIVIGVLMCMIFWIVVFAVAALACQAATPPRRLAPPWVCTMKNRLEIYVDEDRIMYACECEVLATGHICKWQVIGGVDTRPARRFTRTHANLAIVYALPGVTG